MAVVIETTVGDITVDLFTERRPQTCKNFLKLCKLKYYNFCLFHSIQANFIAQTGDPTGIGTGGESVFGVVYGNNSKYYEAEKVPKIKHDKAGLLSMVNCGNNMLGSQFFVTLSDDLQSLEEHCVFAEVTEGHEILVKLNDAICDNLYRPYQDIRITHTVILDDPFEDIPGMIVPIRSPDVPKIHASNGRIGADEKINDLEGLTETQLNDLKAEREAKARATILEIVGDLPHADVAPPENVLFVCKLNPVTTDDDLEIIFSRFGKIKSCEVIRDHQSGDSLQYAFIEFEDQKACEQAYLKMDNVLIDDRRIHVDFSQSVSKIKWRGKGRGVQYIDTKDDDKESSHYSDRYVSKRDTTRDKDGRDNRDRNDRRRDDDRSRRRTERESEDRRRRDRRKEEPRRRDEDTWRESERYEEERKRREQLREERRRDEERRYTRREERRREEERRRDLEKKRSNGSDRKHKETSRRSETQVDSKKDPKDDLRVTENNRVRSADIKRENSATSVKVAKPVEVPLKNIISQPEPEPSKPLKKDPQIKEEAINNVSSSSNDTPKMNHAAVAENDASDSVSLDKVDSMSVKVPDEKDRKKKKRKRTSTSSASSSSDSSASTTSSSSVDRKKKSKRSLTVAKKYYHRGKLVKVVKKKKRKSSDSESLTESSDSDRKKKKSKYSRKVVKVIKKKRRHSSDDTDSDSSSSDDSDSSRYSRRRRKKHDRNNKKKRKDSGRKAKKKKGQNSSDESSGSEDGNDTRKK